jgi:hypothetical protein
LKGFSLARSTHVRTRLIEAYGQRQQFRVTGLTNHQDGALWDRYQAPVVLGR